MIISRRTKFSLWTYGVLLSSVACAQTTTTLRATRGGGTGGDKPSDVASTSPDTGGVASFTYRGSQVPTVGDLTAAGDILKTLVGRALEYKLLLTAGAGVSLDKSTPGTVVITNSGVIVEADTLQSVMARGATSNIAMALTAAGTALSVTNNVTIGGTVTGASFSGVGTLLTALNASNVTLGTMADARLSVAANDAITKRHSQNTDTGTSSRTFDVDSGSAFSNASFTAQGGSAKITWDNGGPAWIFRNAVDDPVNVEALDFIANGEFIGVGSSLTNLNASAITIGTLPDARLSANVAVMNGTPHFLVDMIVDGTLEASVFSGGLFDGNGSALTNLDAGNVATGILPVARGGTSFGSYTTGDLLQASGSGTLAKLAAVATGNVLISGGVGTVSSFGKVTASHVTSSGGDSLRTAITVQHTQNTDTGTNSTTFALPEIASLRFGGGSSGTMIDGNMGSETVAIQCAGGFSASAAAFQLGISADDTYIEMGNGAHRLSFEGSGDPRWTFVDSGSNLEGVVAESFSASARISAGGTAAIATGAYVHGVSYDEARAAKTGAYTLTDTDSFVSGNATGGAFSLTLPTAVGRDGQVFTIKRTNSGANAVSIATTSGQTIDGAAAPLALTIQNQSRILISDGANWLIKGGYL